MTLTAKQLPPLENRILAHELSDGSLVSTVRLSDFVKEIDSLIMSNPTTASVFNNTFGGADITNNEYETMRFVSDGRGGLNSITPSHAKRYATREEAIVGHNLLLAELGVKTGVHLN